MSVAFRVLLMVLGLPTERSGFNAEACRCASVGKITRINAVVGSDEFKTKYPRKNPLQDFQVIDGFIDILLPSIASGAAGVS